MYIYIYIYLYTYIYIYIHIYIYICVFIHSIYFGMRSPTQDASQSPPGLLDLSPLYEIPHLPLFTERRNFSNYIQIASVWRLSVASVSCEFLMNFFLHLQQGLQYCQEAGGESDLCQMPSHVAVTTSYRFGHHCSVLPKVMTRRAKEREAELLSVAARKEAAMDMFEYPPACAICRDLRKTRDCCNLYLYWY